MAMKLPVIVTNYSGITAFANERNAYLISVEPDLDELSLGKPIVNELVQHLRQVIIDSQPLDDHSVTIAEGKAIEGRLEMQKFNAMFAIDIMKNRILHQANRRGWIVDY